MKQLVANVCCSPSDSCNRDRRVSHARTHRHARTHPGLSSEIPSSRRKASFYLCSKTWVGQGTRDLDPLVARLCAKDAKEPQLKMRFHSYLVAGRLFFVWCRRPDGPGLKTQSLHVNRRNLNVTEHRKRDVSTSRSATSVWVCVCVMYACSAYSRPPC